MRFKLFINNSLLYLKVERKNRRVSEEYQMNMRELREGKKYLGYLR